MKNSIFKGKSTRTKIYSAITIVAIVVLLAFNLLISHLFSKNLFIADLTPEGFYTLSDKMEAVCHEILDPDENGNVKNIKITFCTDPDYLIGSDSMRATYFMALRLENMFDTVDVETVNVSLDPTAVSMYKTTSRDNITATDMIVSYGAKYRIVNAANFWTSDNFSYNGEYRMASILASITAINQPAAYFVTDHGETYYDPENPESEGSLATAYFAELLMERGLTIKTLALGDESLERIPDDCALLIINNPTRDFTYDPDRLDEFDYVSETEKLDRYLVNNAGAIIVNKAYDVRLQNLEYFLNEWGIAFGEGLVSDSENSLFKEVGSEVDGSTFVGMYDNDEQSFGYAYYNSYSGLSSAPKMVFSNTGYLYCAFDGGEEMVEHGNKYGTRNYADFMKSADSAVVYTDDFIVSGIDEERTLIAASVRTHLDGYTSERTNSYIFCTNSADFYSNELLGNSSYANYNILASVISNISRTDRYATIELGGLSLNSPTYGGKQTVSTTLSTTPTDIYSPDATEVVKTNKGLGNGAVIAYTIIVMSIPVSILTLGIVVFIKRKFL